MHLYYTPILCDIYDIRKPYTLSTVYTIRGNPSKSAMPILHLDRIVESREYVGEVNGILVGV